MTIADLNHIDTLIERLKNLPEILDLRIKAATKEITHEEKDKLMFVYKELDDLLNDLLAFINVKFPSRTDLIIKWNQIDFNPKLGNWVVKTNSQSLISENWREGLQDLESLMHNIRREIALLIDNQSNIDLSNKKNQSLSGKKINWEYILALIALVIGLITLFFGDNLYEKFKNKEVQKPKEMKKEMKK